MIQVGDHHHLLVWANVANTRSARNLDTARRDGSESEARGLRDFNSDPFRGDPEFIQCFGTHGHLLNYIRSQYKIAYKFSRLLILRIAGHDDQLFIAPIHQAAVCFQYTCCIQFRTSPDFKANTTDSLVSRQWIM